MTSGPASAVVNGHLFGREAMPGFILQVGNYDPVDASERVVPAIAASSNPGGTAPHSMPSAGSARARPGQRNSPSGYWTQVVGNTMR